MKVDRGVLRRVTPGNYNLYDEEENLVGSVRRFMSPVLGRNPETHASDRPGTEHWYGAHREGSITAVHPDRHKAARELMFHDEHHVGLHGAAPIVGPEYTEDCPLCLEEMPDDPKEKSTS